MAKLRSNSAKKGRGKPKKSLAGSTSDIVTIIHSNSTNGDNGHILSSPVLSDDDDKRLLTFTKGINTRSGRIRKKSKNKLKVMDNILKSELLIDDDIKRSPKKLPDSPTSNGNNNNDLTISDQNNTEETIFQNSGSSPKRLCKRSPKNGDFVDSMKSLVGKIRVARNIFQDSKDKVEKKSGNYNHVNESSKSNDNNLKNSTNMDRDLRNNVISNMKSILSPDDEIILPETNPQKYVRKRTKQSKNPVASPKEKAKKKKIDHNNIDKSKTKQVRLSNGVVLTLSLLQCDHCDKSFSNKTSLSRHMLSHFNLKPHQCQHCPRKFRCRTSLKLHVERRHPIVEIPIEFHVCHICDKAFQMQENLDLHLDSHIKSETNFKCLFCEQKFSYRLLLLQHEKNHHQIETGSYKCFLCQITFDNRGRLYQHLKTHSRAKDYICQHCGKNFQRLNSIKRHVKVCHSGVTIQCPICFKELKGHLTEHMRVHNQSRPHICPECGQRFTQSTQLKVHRRSHTGDRPYPCRICERSFSHSNALMLHIRRHTGERPFPCAMCHMSFSQLPHMKAHMNKIHNKKCAYKCQKCREFFKLKCELEAHAKGCTVGDEELSFEEKIQASVQVEEVEVESVMSLSKMRFLLALLLTMIASKEKLKYLGFNKRLVDDLLVESLEAMGHTPCKDQSFSPLKRLKTNIETLLEGTIPEHQMLKFKSEKKTTEELLILLTDDKILKPKRVEVASPIFSTLNGQAVGPRFSFNFK